MVAVLFYWIGCGCGAGLGGWGQFQGMVEMGVEIKGVKALGQPRQFDRDPLGPGAWHPVADSNDFKMGNGPQLGEQPGHLLFCQIVLYC